MITPLLEKYILKGWASVQHVSHAFGMLGRIPMQKGKLAVITKITWWPFLNVPFDLANVNNSWVTFFRYNGYFLRINSKKGVHNIPFRNSIKVANLDNTQAFSMNGPITGAEFDYLLLQPGEPVIHDVYIPIEQFCKITIYRAGAIDNPAQTMGPPDAEANELNAPAGVGDVDILQEQVTVTMDGAEQETYSPPSEEYTGLNSPDGAKKWPYYQGIHKQAPGIYYNSELSPDELGILCSTTPLVTFEVVYINKNIADELLTTN